MTTEATTTPPAPEASPEAPAREIRYGAIVIQKPSKPHPEVG